MNGGWGAKSGEDQKFDMSNNVSMKQAMESRRPDQENSEHRAKPFRQLGRTGHKEWQAHSSEVTSLLLTEGKMLKKKKVWGLGVGMKGRKTERK